jgi:hypothetical protein
MVEIGDDRVSSFRDFGRCKMARWRVPELTSEQFGAVSTVERRQRQLARIEAITVAQNRRQSALRESAGRSARFESFQHGIFPNIALSGLKFRVFASSFLRCSAHRFRVRRSQH